LRPVPREELDDLLPHARQVGAKVDEDARGDAFPLAHQAEQDVLRADVVVAELERFAQRQLEDLFGARCKGRRPAGRGRGRAHRLLHLFAHRLERDPELLQRLGGDALPLVNQAKEQVLGADEVVVEQARFLLGKDHDPTGPLGEPLKQVSPPWRASQVFPIIPAGGPYWGRRSLIPAVAKTGG
jgi:hypothetical protein